MFTLGKLLIFWSPMIIGLILVIGDYVREKNLIEKYSTVEERVEQ